MKLRGYLFLLLLTIFQACDQEKELTDTLGKVQFSLSEDPLDGGRIKTGNVSAVVVTIADESGNEIVTNEIISVIAFGDAYISDQLPLSEGNYTLTQFILLDEDGVAFMACPLEGSPMADYVEDPLPIEFQVTAGVTTTVNPEVLPIDDSMVPSDFGYVEFGFRPVDVFDLNVRIVYEENGQEVPVETQLSVRAVGADGEWTKDFFIPGQQNILLKGGFDNYIFEVDQAGFDNYQETFTEDAFVEGEDFVIVLIPKSNLMSFRTRRIFFYSGDPTPNYDGYHTTLFGYENGRLKTKYENWDDYGTISGNQYQYTAENALWQVIKVSNPNKTTLNRDDTGRVTSITYNSPLYYEMEYDIQLTYDGDQISGATVSHVTHAEVPDQTYTYTYDELGRVIYFESYLPSGAILYSGEFTYLDIPSVFPAGYFDEWFTESQAHYTHLVEDYAVIIPSFIIEGSGYQLASYSLNYYNLVNPALEPTLDYAELDHEFNDQGKITKITLKKTNHPNNPITAAAELYEFTY